MNTNVASEFHPTRTLAIAIDFFGVVGTGIADKLLGDRNKRRSGFADLNKLAKLAGLYKNEDALFVSMGTGKDGKSIFLITLTTADIEKVPHA